MSFLNSVLNNSKKFEDPFTHWELNEPLTNDQIEEIAKADIANPIEHDLNYDGTRAIDGGEGKFRQGISDGGKALKFRCFITKENSNEFPALTDLVKELQKISPQTKSLLLTGYGNIATAVAAIKSGAIDYLPKPAEIDQIYDALTNSKEILPPPPENPMTADRIRWEHIQRVFIQCNRNVSETARRLRMHRRTLQRILNKHAPRE